MNPQHAVLLTALIASVIGLSCANGARASETVRSKDERESHFLSLYSDHACAELVQEVNTMSAPELGALRPNILAVIASCAGQIGEWQRSDALFNQATELDPYSDLVAVLHAQSLSRHDPEAAKIYWSKTLQYARSEYLREISREALSGIAVHPEPLNLSSWTWSADAALGTIYHSRAWVRELPDIQPRNQTAGLGELALKSQHWFRSGSISALYELRTEQFLEERGVSTQNHRLLLPFALRVGISEDLIFQPFYGFDLVGNRAFSRQIGIGFLGVAYRASGKQTVAGYAATEHAYFPNLTSTNQAHYHFSFQSEWFPSRWFLRARFSFDNFSAERIAQYRNIAGDFNQSHNDFTFDITARHGLDRISVGVRYAASARIDAHDSNFPGTLSGRTESERRYDFLFEMEPHLIWRIYPQFQLIGYVNEKIILSSVTASDYGVNRNLMDTSIGIKLRTYWSSY